MALDVAPTAAATATGPVSRTASVPGACLQAIRVSAASAATTAPLERMPELSGPRTTLQWGMPQ